MILLSQINKTILYCLREGLLCMSGSLITFEGIEGSGKSTQINLLIKELEKLDYEVLFTIEPGGTEIGDQIRRILLDPSYKKMNNRTEILLYAADRAQHVVEKIIPALKEGKIVISDRYIDSNIAYQGYGRGLEMSMVREINEWVIRGYWPDLTIVLDLAVEEGLKRARDMTPDKNGDRLERELINFHQRVRKAYLNMAAEEKRFKIIQAGRDSMEVHRDILKSIKEEIL